jgi:hypothetical protein
MPPEGRVKRRPRRALAVAAVVLSLVAVACSGGSGPAGTPKATAQPTSAASAGSVHVFIDIVDCDSAGGVGAAAGTIENQGTEPAAYRITMGFFDAAGTKLGEGTADTASAAPGAAVDWSVTAGGLGETDVTCRTVAVTIVGAGQASAPASTAGTSGEYPCTLILQARVEQLAGNALEPGDANTFNHDENGVLWTAAECIWLSLPGPSVEVELEVSDAAGFPSGTVGCPPLGEPTAPISGLGSTATWSWVDPGTELTVGTLRVCSTVRLVDVRVSGPSPSVGELALRAVAVGVATEVLAAP